MEQGREPKFATEEQREAFLPFWYELFGDPKRAQVRFTELYDANKKKYEESPERRFWAVLAASRKRELAEILKDNSTADTDRPEKIKKKLEEAKQARPDHKFGIYLSILVLYEKDLSPSVQPLVKEAQEGLRKLGR
jgi:hypothetical protein